MNPLKRRSAQYSAWGAVVMNSRVTATHIANGVTQLLRLYPSLIDSPLEACASGEDPKALVERVKASLDDLYAEEQSDDNGWRLPPRSVAFCVTSCKVGELYLDRSSQVSYQEQMDPGVKHADAIFADKPTRPLHQLIAGALNADGRVYAAQNARDPTTTGLDFAGATNSYTLDTLHAATLAGLLAHTGDGRWALAEWYKLLARGVYDDSRRSPHGHLVAALGLSSAPKRVLKEDEVQVPLSPLYPLPPGDGWDRLARTAGVTFKRILKWAAVGESRSSTLMALSDAAGLILAAKFLQWAECQPLLMAAPLTPRQRDATVLVAAKREFRGALATLDAKASASDLVEEKHGKSGKVRRLVPSPVVRNLLQATGWLLPRNAQGGAKQHVGPGDRQLTTLTYALLSPEEGDISWEEWRQRALELHIDVGGPSTGEGASRMFTRTRAGHLNQEAMIALGLARQESDNVIRVDGGRGE